MNARQRIVGERWEKRRFSGQECSDLDFAECSFHRCSFIECTFTNVRFKNCYLGFGSKYERCVLKRCSLTGKYSAFSEGSFVDCDFQDFVLRSASMDARFVRCRFTGRWQAVFLYGEGSPLGETVFDDVDLSGTEMRNVMFYGADVGSVVLPSTSVRVFSNPNGAFSAAITRVLDSVSEDDRSALRVLGDVDAGRVLDPKIICTDVLDSMLSADGRRVFESVAEEWEADGPGADA